MNTTTLAAPAINFDEAMWFLRSASTDELFHLKNYIANEIELHARLEHVKAQRRVGQSVEYFSSRSHAMCQGIVCKTNIKYAVIEAHDGSGRWKAAYCSINSNSHPIHNDKPTTSGSLNKNNLTLGDTVGFTHKGVRIICTITTLNLKTASLLTTTNERWNVYYEYLFPIIEGEIQAARTVDILPKTID